MWVLHVLTYELDDDDRPAPVVEHLFYGKTKAEAEHVAESHRKTDSFWKTDSFFKGCGSAREKNWRGIACYSDTWWESR